MPGCLINLERNPRPLFNEFAKQAYVRPRFGLTVLFVLGAFCDLLAFSQYAGAGAF